VLPLVALNSSRSKPFSFLLWDESSHKTQPTSLGSFCGLQQHNPGPAAYTTSGKQNLSRTFPLLAKANSIQGVKHKQIAMVHNFNSSQQQYKTQDIHHTTHCHMKQVSGNAGNGTVQRCQTLAVNLP